MSPMESGPEHADHSPHDAPAATAAPQGRSWLGWTGKVALYSFLGLSAGTLLAAQYVPEVANTLSFLLPEETARQCPAMKNRVHLDGSGGSSSCCSAASSCPSEMTLVEVDPALSPSDQIASIDVPPIPPIVD